MQQIFNVLYGSIALKKNPNRVFILKNIDNFEDRYFAICIYKLLAVSFLFIRKAYT